MALKRGVDCRCGRFDAKPKSWNGNGPLTTDLNLSLNFILNRESYGFTRQGALYNSCLFDKHNNRHVAGKQLTCICTDLVGIQYFARVRGLFLRLLLYQWCISPLSSVNYCSGGSRSDKTITCQLPRRRKTIADGHAQIQNQMWKMP